MSTVKIVASVPLKKYLLKFVERQENIQPGQAMSLKSHGLAATLLQKLLTQKMNVKTEAGTAKDFSELNGVLRFKVSARMQAYSCFYITRKSILLYNHLIGRYFHELLYDRIRYGIQMGMDEKQVIYDFMKEYDIEEDISFDALKKANYRLRKNKKNQNIRQQKCQTA